MFPSFESKADRENKRRALLGKYNRELQNDEAKREAYATTLWASDQEKNTLSLLAKSRTTFGMQTDVSTNTTNNKTNSNPDDNNSTSPDSVENNTAESSEDVGEQVPFSHLKPTESSEDVGKSSFYLTDELAQQLIKELYTTIPKLATLHISPISSKDNKPNNTYYFGALGELYNEQTRKPVNKNSRVFGTTDWKASLHYIQSKGTHLASFKGKMDQKTMSSVFGKLYENVLTSVNERDDMVNEGREFFEDKPDSVDTAIEENLRELRAPIERYSVNLNTKAGSDSDIKSALNALVVNNQNLVRMYPIVAIKKDGIAIGNPYKLDPHLLEIVTRSGNKTEATEDLQDKISWKATYDAWLQKLSTNKKLDQLNTANTSIQTRKTKRGLADSNSSQRPEATRMRLSQVNEGYLSRIQYLYSKYPDLADERIPIVVQNPSTGTPEFDQAYLWSINGSIVDRLTNKPISLNNVWRRIVWGRSYLAIRQQIVNILTEMRQRGMTSEFNTLNRVLNGADSISLTGDDTEDAVADFVSKKLGMGTKIIGRGLTGAGVKTSSSLRGYSYTSKNLRSIQGSGTASDLKYKQLGSKFIRITDLRLDQPRLKLVYPNRTQVGRIIDISKPLAKCLEHLVFEQDVNQQMYNKLSIDDKQVVHDLLRLCHLDTTFLNPISNPMEQLQAEFDKLRSQVMLGNDNPDNIRELKTLSLDLYNNKLISDEQMRQILSL